jgi:exopolyphosphatase/guanosine-5'-triphosphate,3'-diphosphate pyrophosphatase
VNAACVRLAEGLDRSHAQVLESVRLHDRGKDCVLQLNSTGDAELELWAAGRHVNAFEDLLGKTVRFEVAAARQRRAAGTASPAPDRSA